MFFGTEYGRIYISILRILYFSPRECWPLDSGAHLRDFYLARELARRASLSYFGFHDADSPPHRPPPGDAGFATTLVRKDATYTPSKLLRGFLGPEPVTILNFHSARAVTELEKVLNQQQFDLVQIEGVHLWPYLSLIRRASGRPVVVADWHDIQSEVMWRYSEHAASVLKRPYARRTARLLENMERRFLEECDVHTVASERERGKLLQRIPDARIEVIGNGVDIEYHGANADARRHATDLLFVGSMEYHANVDAVCWFARHVWPQIQDQQPPLRFVIAGRKPAPAVRSLATLPGVVVTGMVDDVRPYYRNALAMVVPLRIGSGTRLKILEAMAAGVPVVSTVLGAEGLAVTDDVDILLADSPVAMTNAIRALLDSPERRQRIAEAAAKLVRQHYDWRILGARLYEIHCAALERNRHSRAAN